MSQPTTRYVVGKREGGKRLDQFLHERIPGLSRTRIQRAIRERVTLSWGVKARPATPVRPDGEVRIGYRPLAETPLDIELQILVRGGGWIAVNKPPGIPVHPVNRVLENSLIRILRRQEGSEELRLVHRLDAETSGLLLVARDSPTASALSRAFMDGAVHKEYLALVAGEVNEERGSINLPIGEALDSRIYLKLEAGHGKRAATDWRVERRLAGRTLLRLFPKTGRRHQLRVHLAAIGHPILGDMLYGRPEEDYLRMVRGEGDARQEEGGPARQLLHCALMRFPDPQGGEGMVELTAPVPADFE
jgi:23S rRNA pseudouridine1911/1915/1917 synthase